MVNFCKNVWTQIRLNKCWVWSRVMVFDVKDATDRNLGRTFANSLDPDQA